MPAALGGGLSQLSRRGYDSWIVNGRTGEPLHGRLVPLILCAFYLDLPRSRVQVSPDGGTRIDRRGCNIMFPDLHIVTVNSSFWTYQG